MAFESDLYPDEYFDRLHKVTPFAAPQRKWRERDRDILRLAAPSPRKVVLDLGSARGDVCFLLAPLVQEAIGVDASPKAMALAEAERASAGASRTSGSWKETWPSSPPIPGRLGRRRRGVRPARARGRRDGAPDAARAAAGPEARRRLRRVHAQPRALRRAAEGARRPSQAVSRAHRGAAAPRDPPSARGGGLAGPRVDVRDGSLSRSSDSSKELLWRIPGIGRLFRYRILLEAVPPAG